MILIIFLIACLNPNPFQLDTKINGATAASLTPITKTTEIGHSFEIDGCNTDEILENTESNDCNNPRYHAKMEDCQNQLNRVLFPGENLNLDGNYSSFIPKIELRNKKHFPNKKPKKIPKTKERSKCIQSNSQIMSNRESSTVGLMRPKCSTEMRTPQRTRTRESRNNPPKIKQKNNYLESNTRNMSNTKSRYNSSVIELSQDSQNMSNKESSNSSPKIEGRNYFLETSTQSMILSTNHYVTYKIPEPEDPKPVSPVDEDNDARKKNMERSPKRRNGRRRNKRTSREDFNNDKPKKRNRRNRGGEKRRERNEERKHRKNRRRECKNRDERKSERRSKQNEKRRPRQQRKHKHDEDHHHHHHHHHSSSPK